MSKYIASFDYIDKILIVLSAPAAKVTIISFTAAVGAIVGIASTSFTLFFSLSTGMIKKILNITRKKREKA